MQNKVAWLEPSKKFQKHSKKNEETSSLMEADAKPDGSADEPPLRDEYGFQARLIRPCCISPTMSPPALQVNIDNMDIETMQALSDTRKDQRSRWQVVPTLKPASDGHGGSAACRRCSKASHASSPPSKCCMQPSGMNPP